MQNNFVIKQMLMMLHIRKCNDTLAEIDKALNGIQRSILTTTILSECQKIGEQGNQTPQIILGITQSFLILG